LLYRRDMIALVMIEVTGNANLSVGNWRNPSNRTFRLIYKASGVDNLLVLNDLW